MISFSTATALLGAHAPHLAVETIPLADAAGRICAAPLRAGFAVPSFENSAMDGFAVRQSESAAAAPEAPLTLNIAAIAPAGAGRPILPPGQAVQIMTGAPLPAGADAVYPIEDVAVTRDTAGKATTVTLTRPALPRANVRGVGEDFRAGEIVAEPGTRLTPRHIMAAAALGMGAIQVQARLRLSILATGNEILDPPAQTHSPPPEPGLIYNANAPYLLAAAREAGAEADYAGIIADTPEAFIRAVQAILGQPQPAQLILSTGAVSKGDFDFVPTGLAALGAEILFHRVAIRPGKPVLFARLPGGALFLGLPGNPASTAIGFRFFATPLLRAAQGLPPETPLRLKLAASCTAKPGLRTFLKARLCFNADGNAAVEILPGQESFRISPLTRLNGWAVCPETGGKLEAGSLIDFYPATPDAFAP